MFIEKPDKVRERNGRSPVSIKYKQAPREYKSARGSTASFLICSGDI